MNLRDNNFGEVGWCAIFDALHDNPQNKITKWDLYSEGVRPTTAKSLAAYMAVSASLTSLWLYGNRLGPEGAKALAPALAANASLTSADFSCNRLGPEGAKALAPALAANASLTSADFSCNRLGDEGTEYIATALKESSTSKLQNLKMSRNNIGPKGAAALAGYIAISASLTKVSAAPPFLFWYASVCTAQHPLLCTARCLLQLSRRQGQRGHPKGRARQRGL